MVGSEQVPPKIGSFVMVTDIMTIKPRWVLGRVVEIVRRYGNVVRAFKIKHSND